MSEKWEIKKANIELHRKVAQFFEEKNVELFNIFEQRNLAKRLEKAIRTCKRLTICCDLACGTGNLIEKERFWFQQVVGLDISKEMLKVCKAKGLGKKNTHFLVGDSENLPLRDNIFDIVTMHAALHHIPSQSKCFKEICRVLAKEGIMYIDHEPNSRRLRNAFEKAQRILDFLGDIRARKHRTDQSRSNPLFPPEYRMADVHVLEGFSARETRKQLESIGFSAVKTRYHNTFSSYFFRLPTPFNLLSFIDNVLDNVPLIKHLASNICIWAKK